LKLALTVCLLGVLCSALACGNASTVSREPSRQPASAPASPAPASPPAADTGGFDGGRAFAHVAKLVSIGPRPAGSEAIHSAQDYIESQLKADGCPVEDDDFHAPTPVGSLAMKNIVAKIPGGSPDILLLLTHYDTKRLDNFVGADDGGSSTGLMLEMARLLCGRKNPLTIWIAFLDGEEAVLAQWSGTDNTYGSRELAARTAVSGDLKHIRAVILADMIGPTNLKIRRDSNSTPWLTDLVWSTAERLGYKEIFISASTPVADDHEPFLRRGVPAVDIIDLVDFPYWHTPQDTLDKVSPQSIAIVGQVILESVTELEKKLR
jgi:glutaminyl-peptide cyclotransferase